MTYIQVGRTLARACRPAVEWGKGGMSRIQNNPGGFRESNRFVFLAGCPKGRLNEARFFVFSLIRRLFEHVSWLFHYGQFDFFCVFFGVLPACFFLGCSGLFVCQCQRK